MSVTSRRRLQCLSLSLLALWHVAGVSQSCDLSPIGWSENLYRHHYFIFVKQGQYVQANAKSTFVSGELENILLDQIRTRIPANTCQDRYTLHSPRLVVEAGNLRLAFAVKYQNWSCGWTDGVCSTGLKVYSCRWENTNMLLDKTINFSLTLKPKLEATNITFSAELTNDASTDNLELVASSLFPAASPIFVSLAAEFRRRFAPEVFDPKIKLSGSGASMEQFELAGVQFEYFGRNPDQFALVVQSKLTKVESAICFFRRVIAKAVADSSECSAMRTYMETSQSHAPPGAPPPQDPNLQARIKEFENARSRFKVEYEKRCISKP